MNNNLPKITVITVTYNLIKNGRKEFFKQCLESVHNQTYPNIEHLIIDGASTDGTAEILQEYADKGWIKYISEPDKGLWEAMNKGIKKATGKYIVFLNSDNYYLNREILAECIKYLEKGLGDYSVANIQMTKKSGEVLYKEIKPQAKELFYRTHTYDHETLICSKKIYEQLKYHNEQFKNAIDWEFEIRLGLNGYKRVHVDKIMLSVRLGGASADDNLKLSKNAIQSTIKVFNAYYKLHMTENEFLDIYNHSIYPLRFFDKVQKRIKNIKNFDYNVFQLDFEQMKKISYQNNILKKTYLFLFIPLFSICYKKMDTYYRLLKFIPILKVRQSKSRKYYLFDFIPLAKIKQNQKKKIIYLLGCLPLLKIKEKEQTKKIYLLGFIPLLKIKSS